jgi:hypothetical protein
MFAKKSRRPSIHLGAHLYFPFCKTAFEIVELTLEQGGGHPQTLIVRAVSEKNNEL